MRHAPNKDRRSRRRKLVQLTGPGDKLFMKYPPVQLTDAEAYRLTEALIQGPHEDKPMGRSLHLHSQGVRRRGDIGASAKKTVTY